VNDAVETVVFTLTAFNTPHDNNYFDQGPRVTTLRDLIPRTPNRNLFGPPVALNQDILAENTHFKGWGSGVLMTENMIIDSTLVDMSDMGKEENTNTKTILGNEITQSFELHSHVATLTKAEYVYNPENYNILESKMDEGRGQNVFIIHNEQFCVKTTQGKTELPIAIKALPVGSNYFYVATNMILKQDDVFYMHKMAFTPTENLNLPDVGVEQRSFIDDNVNVLKIQGSGDNSSLLLPWAQPTVVDEDDLEDVCYPYGRGDGFKTKMEGIQKEKTFTVPTEDGCVIYSRFYIDPDTCPHRCIPFYSCALDFLKAMGDKSGGSVVGGGDRTPSRQDSFFRQIAEGTFNHRVYNKGLQ